MSDFTICTYNFSIFPTIQIVGPTIYGSNYGVNTSDVIPLYSVNVNNPAIVNTVITSVPVNKSIAVNGNYIYTAYYANTFASLYVNGQITKSDITTGLSTTFNAPTIPLEFLGLIYDTGDNCLIGILNSILPIPL